MSRPTQGPPRPGQKASHTGLSPSAARRSRRFRSLPALSLLTALLPRHMPRDTAGLGSSPFDRLYSGNRCYFLLLQVLRCFSSLRSPPTSRGDGIAPAGLPHSDIRGSGDICSSPRLFAACHVLLRLREPRHPPCALFLSVFSLRTATASYRRRAYFGSRLSTALSRPLRLGLTRTTRPGATPKMTPGLDARCVYSFVSRFFRSLARTHTLCPASMMSMCSFQCGE